MPNLTRPRRLLLLTLSLTLAACTVGPDYRRPAIPELPSHFKELAGWKVAQPSDDKIASDWWRMFDDPYLHSLVAQVNLSNQSLAQAEAQYRQAQTLVQTAQAAYFPTVNATASTNRFRAATGQSVAVSGVRSLFSTAVSALWEPDLWGQVRRQVEANQANAQASFASLQALRLSLQATLVQNYWQLRILDEQIRVLAESKDVYQKILEITQNQYHAGIIAKADVLQAQAQLETINAQTLDLEVQRSALEHAVALLLGKMPATFSVPKKSFNTKLHAVPISVPATLLERRPDIAAAERQVAAANAQIGVAKAAYFPKITLAATNGFQSSTLSNLISTATRYWAMGPAAFALPLFDGGTRGAQMSSAIATYDANVANYRQIVLTSMQQVEDNLAALQLLEQEHAAQKRATELAQSALQLTTNQFKAGTVGYLQVMTAQTFALSSQKATTAILGQRFNAWVLLVKALGGGWDVHSVPKADEVGGEMEWSQFLPFPTERQPLNHR